jgi:hypothetical protein
LKNILVTEYKEIRQKCDNEAPLVLKEKKKKIRKKIITVTDASSAPNKPALPFTTLIVIIRNSATTEDGRIAPFQRVVSLDTFSFIKHQPFAYLF